MNKQLQEFARQKIKEGLCECTEAQQHLFKRMYSHNNLDANINNVVNSIPEDKLGQAMQQIQAALSKTTKNL